MNPARGETAITVAGRALTLRPSFAALVRAEEELGPLLQWVEKAAIGGVSLSEIVGLFWHCLADKGEVTRETLGDAVVEAGIAAVTPVLKALVLQILKGL